MPRPLRAQLVDGIYHVTARGNRRSAIYRDEGDRALFLSLSLVVLERYALELEAWCLMTTHYHLLLRTPEANLAAAMQYLNARYAEAFNDRYLLSGHVFQGRYHSVLVESTPQLEAAYRYVARNPVRAGACRRADDWPWSSYAGLARGWAGRLYEPPSFARGRRGRPVETLRRLVERASDGEDVAWAARAGV